MGSKDWSDAEELFAQAMREALSHLIAIGAVVDSGFRSEDGAVRWTVNGTHPYWAQIESECPPEIKRN
jgi:hypothetical protein